MCNGCRYQVPGFDSFRPGQVFNAEEFIKMLSEAEHDICPTCGQAFPRYMGLVRRKNDGDNSRAI